MYWWSNINADADRTSHDATKPDDLRRGRDFRRPALAYGADEGDAIPDDYYYDGYYPESPVAPTFNFELEGISSDENDDNHFYI